MFMTGWAGLLHHLWHNLYAYVSRNSLHIAYLETVDLFVPTEPTSNIIYGGMFMEFTKALPGIFEAFSEQRKNAFIDAHEKKKQGIPFV